MLVATSITPSLQNFQLDGVVGLGLSQNSSLGGESYLESLIGSGGLSDAEAVLGLHLTPTGGDLIVGGTDTSKFKGDLVFINIDKPVSRLRDIPCPRLTRTRYRVSGRCRWIPSQSMEPPWSPLRKRLLTRAVYLSLVTMRLSLGSIAISPIRPEFQTLVHFKVRM